MRNRLRHLINAVGMLTYCVGLLIEACWWSVLWVAMQCIERAPRALRAAWRVWCVLGGLWLAGYAVGMWWMMRLP